MSDTPDYEKIIKLLKDKKARQTDALSQTNDHIAALEELQKAKVRK